tara:strand:+ start:50 stop:352 length:303 start_codon:yes stop_codon:yes gene_type:complete
MKLLILFFFFSIFLTSCSGIGDAGKILRNEKIKTTDEFLVKKRNPLILPPNYEEIPEPGSITEKKQTQEDRIKKILNAPQAEKTRDTSSTEESILNRIKK